MGLTLSFAKVEWAKITKKRVSPTKVKFSSWEKKLRTLWRQNNFCATNFEADNFRLCHVPISRDTDSSIFSEPSFDIAQCVTELLLGFEFVDSFSHNSKTKAMTKPSMTNQIVQILSVLIILPAVPLWKLLHHHKNSLMPLTRHFKNKADDQALDDVSSSSNGDSAHNLASSALMKAYQMIIKM